MAIDIRATVSCSLGTLISGSLSDDYLQGTGLVKCKGSCEISGTITPAIGTVVTFTYTKGGITRTVPRKLRVLSSFADPFRRTTKVELGCKLTYLADLREAVNWKAFDDPGNASYTTADAEVITLPIRASSVMDQCLTQLGLTASSNPLTSQFSVASFDFGPGYVQVLSDLLVSESYCGYLDENEVLQVVSLAQEGGTGPVIASSAIIDLGPIGVGQLPGEAVTVSYSTLKLKQPDTSPNAFEPLWEQTVTSNVFSVPISYSTPQGSQQVQVYNVRELVETTNSYTEFKTADGQEQRVLSKRTTKTYTQAAAVVGGLVAEYLSNGIAFNDTVVQHTSVEEFKYDKEGNETYYERNDIGSAPFLQGSAGVPWVFSATDYVALDYTSVFPLEREQRYTTIAANSQQVETLLYGPWGKTIAGQQAIASARDSFTTAAQVTAYLNEAYNTTTRGLPVLEHRLTTEMRSAPQFAPAKGDVFNLQYAKDGNAANGYRTESTAELSLALGSATAQRRVEFSLPYAPDDVFTKTGSTYKAVSSAAEAVAVRYGRAQNMLLLGNRSGMNLQLAPETLPAAPFAPFIVQANGLSALYRTNGSSWTMDASGVVASTDALFWGAVGGSGTFWFPVAPGVTALPTAPAVVNGQMTVSTLVPPYNETVLTQSRTRVGVTVASLNYALALLTTVDPLRVRTRLSATQIRIVEIPLTTMSVAGLAAEVALGTVVRPPVGTVALAAPAFAVAIDTVVAVPTTSMAVAALAPAQAGPDGVDVAVPLTNFALAALVPEGVGAEIETFAGSYVPQVYGWQTWIYPDWWAD